MRFNRKESYPTPTLEEASHLQERLAEINSKLESYEARSINLAQQRKSGQMHDGLYNIEVSAIGQTVDTLMKERERILDRIGKIQEFLAHSALGA